MFAPVAESTGDVSRIYIVGRCLSAIRHLVRIFRVKPALADRRRRPLPLRSAAPLGKFVTGSASIGRGRSRF
jgi:hypothetical protein